MRAGILAAGFGSRLRAAVTSTTPKALVPVAGRPLVDWVLADLDEAGASAAVIIINERSTAVRDHVERSGVRLPVTWIVETTPSSMHSFLRVLEELARDADPGPFLITTVDTIAPPGTFRAFADAAARAPQADIVFALTTLIEDENPLRIRIDGAAQGDVTAIGDGPYVSAGYYLVSPAVLLEAAAGRRRNFGALRYFFGHLFECGSRLAGIRMPDSIDVDRPSEVAAAEQLLRARVV